jgi:hypothetical protein
VPVWCRGPSPQPRTPRWKTSLPPQAVGLGDENEFDLALLLSRREQRANAEVIIVSARAETDYADLIAESPAAGFLTKSDLSAQQICRILGRQAMNDWSGQNG